MDNLVFEESISSEVSQSEFISKKWLYVNDINNGSYASQIIIDSTPLANSGGYVNWSEGYIAMPLVVTLEGAGTTIGDDASLLGNHSWAFKNGFWNMINSMSVEFNNQNIVQQTPFLNVFRSFKAMTSFSEDDLKQGASLGFSPDTAGSWSFNDAYTANGIGLSNNRTTPEMIVTGITANDGIESAFSSSTNPSNLTGSQYAFNAGFAKRNEWYGYTPVQTSKGQQLINNNDTCASVFRARRLPETISGLSNTKAGWAVMAKLRLKDLSDYFDKCPMLKGSTMRFLINTNQTTTTFTTTSAGASQNTTSTFSAVSVTSNGLTNPLMISSGDKQQGTSELGAATYTLKVSIFKDGDVSPFGVPVRLYAPVYKMNPIAEQRYLSLAPTKRIEYCDIFQYQFPTVGAGQSFNFLVSNGIPNIKSVLVVPFLTSAANTAGVGGGTVNIGSTLLSPFSTSGATPDPITLTQFNILISGVNLFLNNQQYDFEQFRHELMSSNQLNGSLTTGLASGLISEDDFSRGMRYYYGNASRILPSEEGVSRSVQILGINASNKAIDLMVFVEFKKSMTIDISTGARLD